jgi:hypothetical protein
LGKCLLLLKEDDSINWDAASGFQAQPPSIQLTVMDALRKAF